MVAGTLEPVSTETGATRSRQSLGALFHPKSVALIGATETAGSVGRTVLKNLVGSPFGGTVYPINPKRASVLGIRAYPTVADVPERVDLAVIVTPAPAVPNLIAQCAKAGVRGVVVISAGFKELGAAGAGLEQEILTHLDRRTMRLIGPNCLGLMNPVLGLNATFAAGIARPGHVAFISQSGALLTAILDWSRQNQVGFSSFVSTGSMLDVSWGDLIDYLGDDPHTRAILIYMESIGDARAFLSAAREVALTKPIIVIKPGRTEQAARAASSHTGALTGGDEVIDAAFRRCGVLRVETIAELFYMADILSKQPRPRGPRLTVVTNAGGPGVLATDALVGAGGQLAQLAPQTVEELNKLLPGAWSRNNPIDVLGDANAERYARTLDVVAEDPNSDGLLVVLTPQDMTEPTQTAELLRKYAKIEKPFPKPVLASWMGGPAVEAGADILKSAGIPAFPYPDTAARMFVNMWRYSQNLRGLYETPAMPTVAEYIDRDIAHDLIAKVRAAGRTLLSEQESKALLSAYGIPAVMAIIAKTAKDAGDAAEKIGYPVVLKLNSLKITHKSDVGGVQLNLGNRAAVKHAFQEICDAVTAQAGADAFNGVSVQPMVRLEDSYELILGSSLDPLFGPVLLFGAGGQLVEVFKDRSLGLPPLNATLARRMMEQSKVFRALQGVRGRKPVDIAALEQLLVRFSQLVAEQRWVKEIDINPLLASSDRLIALDARVILHDPAMTEDQLPTLPIRPYPTQYVGDWINTDGKAIIIRPIRPEDEPLLVKFHRTLSERTLHNRYFASQSLDMRTAHDRLIRTCFNDYDRELALVAEPRGTDVREIVAVARLSKIPGTTEAEFAIVISDQAQGKGLGSELMRRLIAAARQEKISRLVGDILPSNLTMQRLCKKLGFQLDGSLADSVITAELVT